jgi:tetratricopeptide (TPR) repeat protein
MKNRALSEKTVGLALVALALVVYVVTLSSGAFPGQSASLIVSHGGLFPQFSPGSPLWTGLVAVVRAVSGDRFVQSLNLISAICAAASVGLLYSLTREGVTIFIEELSFTEVRKRQAAILGAAGAGLCLCFCIPFWIVANRAHTAAFDLFLLLLTARLLMAYMDYGKLWIALLFSFMFGLGVVEFATFIVIAPLFGAWLLYVMYKRDVLRFPIVLALIVSAIVGLSAYLLAAWAFYETPGYALRHYGGFFDIVWHMWREQYFLIARSLPREGWLVILFVTVVPWLAMLSVARRGLNDERDWGLYFLHMIMTGLAIAVILNTKIAPFAILGMRRLLVTPYVLVAMVYGYLVAYWFLLPSGWGRDPEAVLTRFYRRYLGWLFALPLVGLLLWAPVRNMSAAGTGQTRFVRALSDAVIESLEGREWIVADGVLDNHLLLAANRNGIPLKVINIAAGNSSVYLDYLASQFEETRMQNLAKIGISALLSEWMRTDPEFPKKVAVLSMPDMWSQGGFHAIPNRLVFLGTKDISSVDVNELYVEHEAFWAQFAGALEEAASVKGQNPWLEWGRRHAGRVANNLGVLLDDAEQSTKAFSAYKAARTIDSENVSALLNMGAAIDAGRVSDPEGTVKQALSELDASMDKKYHIWSLARHYGYVRSPQAFAQLGWTWAYSGQSGMAISELEKASDMLPAAEKDGVRGLMAEIFLKDNRATESEEIYREILSRDKENQAALQGMVQICLGRREFENAEAFLSRMAASGAVDESVALQRAGVAFAAGDVERAKQLLEALLDENRKLLRGWVLLAEIAFSEQDSRTLDKCLRRLTDLEGDRGYFGSLIHGRRALKTKDVRAAAEHFEVALSQNPRNLSLKSTLLRLELMLGDQEMVQVHAKELLRDDPHHTMALYALGSIQISDGEFALAEDSLRNSLRKTRMPMALNDLAWLIHRRGDLEEAEQLIDEAISLKDKQHAFWDTKGGILLSAGRFDAAVEAFGTSLAIFDRDPSVHLHMGEAQLALGHKAAVKQIIELLLPRKDALSPDNREILSKLQTGIE